MPGVAVFPRFPDFVKRENQIAVVQEIPIQDSRTTQNVCLVHEGNGTVVTCLCEFLFTHSFTQRIFTEHLPLAKTV